ncbi:hypothetical protein KDI_51790 [Dictyobacter arantiisoli]|uniref:histidine kinase n=1 Tax=Dictyobacter arantiisoli TaxID=2014874 RepID=A0A5A5TK32_9CHLR|nr:hypothetical protein KDI_51790 [Dictyobacter arantiisoli]
MDKQNVYRYAGVASFFVGVFCGSGLLWILFVGVPFGVRAIEISALIVMMVTALIGAFWSWQSLHWAHSGLLQLRLDVRFSWLFIGLALLSFFGRGVYNLLLWSGSTVDYATVHPMKFVLYGLFYPCLFVSLLYFPGTSRLRVSMIVDILITTCCLVGLSWYVLIILLTPAHLSAVWSLRLSADLCYVAGDIFLLLLLLLRFQEGIQRAMWRPALLVGGALLFLFSADVAGAWLDIASIPVYYPACLWIDLSYSSGLLLLGLSTLYQYGALLGSEPAVLANVAALPTVPSLFPESTMLGWETQHSRWHIQNMYVPLGLILGGVSVWVALHLRDLSTELVQGLFLVCALVGLLIVVRHFFATRENNTLLQERDQRFKEAEQVRYLVSQLTDILDIGYLRERIMNVVISQFGFTSVMLLLIEEYTQPFMANSHILVGTASRLVQSTNWRLSGESILSWLLQEGKECELYWADHARELPGEVLRWQEKQHVPSMQFFPIIYQGRIRGSLGVARHVLARTDALTAAIVRGYAHQIATIIEHAYLYQEAQEREMFARAMVNISTRLNAAVMDPTEMGQLICSEGARALNADVVLFYLRLPDGSLTPFAASTGEQIEEILLDEWPTLHLPEYEEETAYPLQPFLLHVSPSRKSQPQASQGNSSNDGLDSFFREQLPGSRQFALRAKLLHHHIHTAIIAPLLTNGLLNGILMLARWLPPGSTSDPSFNETALSHAQDFVEQASVTFTNAQLYQHLSTAHEQLKELDQLKDHFMTTASHELRTPLTAVQGYIELIAQYDDELPPEQRHEFLQKAQLGCEELAILLNNVMDASRIEAEAAIKPALLTRVSVNDILAKVQLMIEPQLTYQERQLTMDIPAQYSVYADPVRLHQVLMNISTNALKYSPPGTPIHFAVARSTEHDKAVVISITDVGKGIAPQEQSRVFQRFYRLESDVNSPIRGSGLGLYISWRLIEAMGGKIWIESRGVPGGGSTFHILLPMA